MKSESVSRSVLSDSATLWTVCHQASLSMEFSRQEYWSRLPFLSLGDLPHPGIKLGSPALQADYLQSEPPGKPFHIVRQAKLIVSHFSLLYPSPPAFQCRTYVFFSLYNSFLEHHAQQKYKMSHICIVTFPNDHTKNQQVKLIFLSILFNPMNPEHYHLKCN